MFWCYVRLHAAQTELLEQAGRKKQNMGMLSAPVIQALFLLTFQAFSSACFVCVCSDFNAVGPLELAAGVAAGLTSGKSSFDQTGHSCQSKSDILSSSV